MTVVYDVPASRLIKEVAKALRKVEAVKPPKWAPFVKTGTDREKAPEEKDWWYTRCASVLRKVHVYGPVGIMKLRRKYGGKANRGHNPEAKRGGSGAVIRIALQQLERAGLVKKTKEGRVTTPKGTSLLDDTAHEIKKEIPELRKY